MSKCVGRPQAVSLVNVVQETQLETPFKGDNVKALIKTSNYENSVHYFSEKMQKIATVAMLFWFSGTQQSFEKWFRLPPMIRNTHFTR